MSFARLRLILLVALSALQSSCEKTYVSRYLPGPIQIIGNNEHLYIFLEIDRIVSRGDAHYDAPGANPVGHHQELLILNAGGLKERINIHSDDNIDGVTFHPNNALVFSHKGNFFIFSPESMNYKDSIFEWSASNHRFVLKPPEQAEEILKAKAASKQIGMQMQSLKALSREDGLDIYFSDALTGDDSFDWNGVPVTISVVDKGERFEIVIAVNNGSGGYPVNLSYDKNPTKLDENGFKALSRECYGHPK